VARLSFTVEDNLLATASDRPVNADISSLQNAAPTCICSKRIHTWKITTSPFRWNYCIYLL